MDTKSKTDKIERKVEKEGKTVQRKKEILETELKKYLGEGEEDSSESSEEEDNETKTRKEIEKTRKALPVYSYRDELLAAIRDN